MRNIKKMLKEDDLGDMGIGAMIVFIAMVLVAGIAASVLIQTANRLEIQAMQTGQETTEEVATGIGIEDITGQIGAGAISNITICVSPRSGSKDIDLSNTVVELSDSTNKYLIIYNTTLACNVPAATGVFDTTAFATDASFSIIVLEDADGSCVGTNPVINRGDHVLLAISADALFGGLTERTDIWGMVIPESGAPGVFAFRTPASYPDTVYDLY
ncbi:MAG TPA: flagellin [Candidatus Thermoplasmatota archaeon]|nr:flagellin [Candidatus Thermoplasmatota archaeon]